MEHNHVTYNFVNKNIRIPVGILSLTISGILVYKTYKSEQRKDDLHAEIIKNFKEEMKDEL